MNQAKTGAVETQNKSPMEAKTRSYDDFEPFCEWQREEGRETLAVHLPDFKKDQLKVNVNNAGLLKITGERPIDKTDKWSRFIKENRIPKTCNVDDVQAKFVGDVLFIIMPNKKALQDDNNVTETPTKYRFGLESLVSRLTVSKKVTVNVVAAVAVVVALGAAYATFKYRSSHVDN